MKKVLSVLLVVFGLLFLAGCQETNPNQILFEAYALDGTLIVREKITFEPEANQSVFELILEKVDIDYTESEWGAFINGIEGHYPKEYGASFNYSFALYVNDVFALTGISDIALSENLKITFKEEFASWLDQTDLMVDTIIYDFIQNKITDYINATTIDYHVISALSLLNGKGYPVPQANEILESITSFVDLENLSKAFRSAIYQTIYQLDTSETKTALEGFEITNPWAATSALTALSLVGGNPDKINTLVGMVAQTFEYIDSDYVGMAMVALAKHKDNQAVIDIMDIWLDIIYDNQTEEGMSSPFGGVNSASTATVIIGLVAQGYNPRSEAFTVEGVDLIEALVAYYIDGGFKDKPDSETYDLGFSTTQAFAALVVYKIFRDVWGNPAVDLYQLN